MLVCHSLDFCSLWSFRPFKRDQILLTLLRVRKRDKPARSIPGSTWNASSHKSHLSAHRGSLAVRWSAGVMKWFSLKPGSPCKFAAMAGAKISRSWARVPPNSGDIWTYHEISGSTWRNKFRGNNPQNGQTCPNTTLIKFIFASQEVWVTVIFWSERSWICKHPPTANHELKPNAVAWRLSPHQRGVRQWNAITWIVHWMLQDFASIKIQVGHSVHRTSTTILGS